MKRFVLLWAMAGSSMIGFGLGACAAFDGAPASVADPIEDRHNLLAWCEAKADVAETGKNIAAYDACLADAGLVDTYSKKSPVAACLGDGGMYMCTSNLASDCSCIRKDGGQ